MGETSQVCKQKMSIVCRGHILMGQGESHKSGIIKVGVECTCLPGWLVILILSTCRSLSKYERRVGEKLFKNEPTEKQCTIEQNDTSSDDVPLESVPVKDKASTDEQDETKKTKKSKAKSNRQYRSTSTRSKSKSVKSNKKNISPDKENEKTNKVANEQNPTEDHTLTNVNTKHQTVKEGVDITPSAEKGDSLEGWQLMSTQENCKVYSKPCGNGGLCQYKVIGFYENITARDFLDVQVG